VTTDDPRERCRASTEIAEELSRRFHLGELQAWQDLGGSWTTNLRLDVAAGSLVARVHRDWTTEDRLAAVQTARQLIAESGIPAVLPLPDPHGSTIITLDNGRLAELEPYIGWNRRMNTPELLSAGFPILARIHDTLRTGQLGKAARTVEFANHVSSADAATLTHAGADRMIGWHDEALTGYATAVTHHIDAVTALEAELSDEQLGQVVHGDFWDNNVLFADDELQAVIDYDFMAERWRVDDLALTIWFYLLEPGHGLPTSKDRELVKMLLDSYDASASVPLSAAERRTIPLAIARQPAWSAGGWVRVDDDVDRARRHAYAAAKELPVAQQILLELGAWQTALSRA